MSGTLSNNAEGAVYVIQTLVDDKWVTFKKFADPAQVKQSLGSLLDLWGRQRVRVLIGNFDLDKQRRIYSNITDEIFPELQHTQAVKTGASGGFRLGAFFRANKIKITLATIGAIISALFAVSYPSFAGNSPRTAVAAIEYPFDIRQKFVAVIGMSYGRLQELPVVPPRMQGKWSADCTGGLSGYEFGTTLMQMQGSEPLNLAGVLQKGQDYGLMLEDGTILLMEMKGVDRLQPKGHLSKSGDHRQADASASILVRCL